MCGGFSWRNSENSAQGIAFKKKSKSKEAFLTIPWPNEQFGVLAYTSCPTESPVRWLIGEESQPGPASPSLSSFHSEETLAGNYFPATMEPAILLVETYQDFAPRFETCS